MVLDENQMRRLRLRRMLSNTTGLGSVARPLPQPPATEHIIKPQECNQASAQQPASFKADAIMPAVNRFIKREMRWLAIYENSNGKKPSTGQLGALKKQAERLKDDYKGAEWNSPPFLKEIRSMGAPFLKDLTREELERVEKGYGMQRDEIERRHKRASYLYKRDWKRGFIFEIIYGGEVRRNDRDNMDLGGEPVSWGRVLRSKVELEAYREVLAEIQAIIPEVKPAEVEAVEVGYLTSDALKILKGMKSRYDGFAKGIIDAKWTFLCDLITSCEAAEFTDHTSQVLDLLDWKRHFRVKMVADKTRAEGYRKIVAEILANLPGLKEEIFGGAPGKELGTIVPEVKREESEEETMRRELLETGKHTPSRLQMGYRDGEYALEQAVRKKLGMPYEVCCAHCHGWYKHDHFCMGESVEGIVVDDYFGIRRKKDDDNL